MTRKNGTVLCLILLWTLGAQSQGWSQADYRQHQTQIIRLAEVMGGSHYLRGICDKADNQIWRAHMLSLLELEQPPQEMREEMVSRFNANYDRARRSFSKCNRKATRELSKLAQEGEQLTGEISQGLSF